MLFSIFIWGFALSLPLSWWLCSKLAEHPKADPRFLALRDLRVRGVASTAVAFNWPLVLPVALVSALPGICLFLWGSFLSFWQDFIFGEMTFGEWIDSFGVEVDVKSD